VIPHCRTHHTVLVGMGHGGQPHEVSGAGAGRFVPIIVGVFYAGACSRGCFSGGVGLAFANYLAAAVIGSFR
jgi:hypothetical protein